MNESLLTLQYLQMAQDMEEDQYKVSKEDFDLVVDCTHYSGTKTKNLPETVSNTVWTLANGFGTVSLQYLAETLEWDWSHIRDSDSTSVAAMASYLREQGCA